MNPPSSIKEDAIAALIGIQLDIEKIGEMLTDQDFRASLPPEILKFLLNVHPQLAEASAELEILTKPIFFRPQSAPTTGA